MAGLPVSLPARFPGGWLKTIIALTIHQAMIAYRLPYVACSVTHGMNSKARAPVIWEEVPCFRPCGIVSWRRLPKMNDGCGLRMVSQ